MKTINNNIEERLVSFPLAKLLKEAGFECKTFSYCYKDGFIYYGDKHNWNIKYSVYGDVYSRPTQQVACDWIAENFGLYVYCECDVDGNYYPHISICKEEVWQDLELRHKVVNAFREMFREISEYKDIKTEIDAALEYTLTNLILKK